MGDQLAAWPSFVSILLSSLSVIQHQHAKPWCSLNKRAVDNRNKWFAKMPSHKLSRTGSTRHSTEEWFRNTGARPIHSVYNLASASWLRISKHFHYGLKASLLLTEVAPLCNHMPLRSDKCLPSIAIPPLLCAPSYLGSGSATADWRTKLSVYFHVPHSSAGPPNSTQQQLFNFQ